jgi:hypothetical protein
MNSSEEQQRSGSAVTETGIYRVIHVAQRLPHEVVCLKGDRFPRCAKCNDTVLFYLVHSAPDLFRSWQYHLYVLPVLEDDSASEMDKAKQASSTE